MTHTSGRRAGIRPGTIRVDIREGVVTLTGRVEERSLIPVIERLCRSVDGVVAVHQSIGYAHDDLGSDREPPRLSNRRDRGQQTTAHRE
ncbi:BON domain-containing protein [Streptomyces sp. NPDC002519]